jgi:predicted esterase
MRRPRLRTVVLAAVVIVLLVGAGAFVWLVWPQTVLPEGEAAMASTADVTVTTQDGITAFTPTGSQPTTGLIVYPGAKVPVAAYAPMAQTVAESGFAVFLVDMPLNLAILGADRALDVQAANADIEHWVLWGHSLGGAMAGQVVADDPGAFDGLVLCGAYPNGDLSDQDIVVASIYGTLDAGAERITSDATKAQLPADTSFVPIEGGNHENCGWYEGQANDPESTITRDAQQGAIAAATLEVLDKVAGTGSRAVARSASPAIRFRAA